MSALVASDLVDARALLAQLAALFELQVGVYYEAVERQPSWSELAPWNEWVGELRAMQRALADRGPATARLTPLLQAQQRMSDRVRALCAAAPSGGGAS
jgi:hypothetical protein